MTPESERSYCAAHVDLVGALERCSAILDRASTATDGLIEKVQGLSERIARLETRLSLFVALFGTCAGAAGWMLGALFVHWLGNK